MRNSARGQLAGEIPPAMLGEIIGVNANTATRWAAMSGGNWLSDAADATHDRGVADARPQASTPRSCAMRSGTGRYQAHRPRFSPTIRPASTRILR